MKPSPPERPERRTRSRIAVPAAPTLRQQAVAALQAQAKQPPQRQPADAPETNRQLLHELSVHQIQLELQNEELRCAQLEIDASRARYFDLYDLAPVAYCTVSASGQIALANLACATLLDLPRAALTHKMLARFVHHESSDGYFLFCKKTFDSDAPQDCELRMQKSDGTPFWARLEAVATQDADGAPALRSVLIDISASKRDEQKLRDMAQGLEAIVSQRTQQLRAAWAQLTLSEERERRLLAQDLHDNLGQLLAILTSSPA